MAFNKNIRGITVKIGGDTTELGQSLDKVIEKSNNLQSELKGVNKLLKVDPNNIDLLRQKQDLLTDSISETKKKLDILKESEKQIQEQYEQKKISVEQYRDFQREIVATEQKLDRLTDQMREFGSASATVIANAGNSVKDFGNKVTDIGKNMTQNVTLPIAAGAVALAEGTRELRGDLARLEVNAEAAGYSMSDMESHMTQIVGVTGEVDSSIEGLSNLLATGISPDGFNQIMDSMSGAAIKFSDTLKFEGIADGLQETLATGAAVGSFGELLERSGIVLDDFNAGLETAISNGTQENYILQTLATTGLADYYNAYRTGNPDLVEATEAEYKLQTQLAELGKMIAPIVAKFTDFAAKVLEAFNSMSPEAKNFTLLIVGLAAAIAPLIVIIGSIITHVGTILTLAPKFATALNAVKGAFALLNATMAANPIGAVIVAITAVIAILVTAYNKCEWFRNGVNKVVNEVVAFFKSIPSKLGDLPAKMKGIGKDLLEGLWNGIKNVKGWLIKKIKGLGGSVLDGIREAFDTHSPSKETEKIGEDVGEGLAIGLENKTDTVVNAAKTMSDEALAEIEQGKNRLTDKLEDFGDLFTLEKDDSGNSIFSFGDLQSDIDKMIAYANASNTLRTKGVTDGLLGEIADMDVDDALMFMDELLKLTDEKLNEYVSLYEQKQTLAQQVATAFYSTAASGEVIDDETETALAVGTEGTAENVAGKTVESLKENLKQKITDNKPEFINIGDMMMDGIEQGVKRGESGVVNAMVRAVKTAIRKAKEAAKIKSPSQEMRDEVGKQLSRGMAVGITDAMNEPVDAMSDAVRGVIDRGVNVSRDIDSTFTGANNGVPVGDIVSLLTNYLPQIVSASNRQIVLDGGAIVGGTIDTIDARLGQSALLKARGV